MLIQILAQACIQRLQCWNLPGLETESAAWSPNKKLEHLTSPNIAVGGCEEKGLCNFLPMMRRPLAFITLLQPFHIQSHFSRDKNGHKPVKFTCHQRRNFELEQCRMKQLKASICASSERVEIENRHQDLKALSKPGNFHFASCRWCMKFLSCTSRLKETRISRSNSACIFHRLVSAASLMLTFHQKSPHKNWHRILFDWFCVCWFNPSYEKLFIPLARQDHVGRYLASRLEVHNILDSKR